ncbi:MAG: glycosyltransferase family 39 protein, partial [Firmicutes bacterium]|nr:glycosyltransferase family 39 protein [Bacillota bacterium]
MNVIKKRITLEKLLNKINMVFLVILIVIIMVWSDYDAFYLLPVFLVMLAFLFRLNGAAAEKEKKFLIPVTVFAFLLRVNLTLLLYLVSKYAGNHGFWSFAIDSQYYFEAGSKLSAFWSGGPPVKVDVFNTYVYFVAFVYWLFSPKLILTSLFNAFFGTVSVVLLYFISRYLFAHTGRRAVEGITLLAAMFPSFVLWSTQTLKDPLVVLLLLLFVLFFLQYFSDRRVVWMLSAGVTVNLLAGVRNYTAVILVAAVFLNLLVMYLRLREGLDRKKLLLDVSLIGTCVMAIFLSKFGTSIVQSLLQTNLQSIQSMRENVYAIGNTGITEGDVSSPAGALKYLPLGLAYVFLAPFPDMWLIGRGFN